jgi:hypothetical protein
VDPLPPEIVDLIRMGGDEITHGQHAAVVVPGLVVGGRTPGARDRLRTMDSEPFDVLLTMPANELQFD